MSPRWWTTALMLAVLATIWLLDDRSDKPSAANDGSHNAELRELATGKPP